MKFTATAALTLLAGTAIAAPFHSMAASGQRAFIGVKRVCDTADTVCTWTFGISDGTATTPCQFQTKKVGNSCTSTPASQAPNLGSMCGVLQVTSGWSGQFGAGQGFTTLSIVNPGLKTISYPSYTDKELAGGKVVSPDRSYPIQQLS